MNKIIAISREFGSGGRELGRRLADALEIPCYDHEIIEIIAERHGFDKDCIAHLPEKDIRAACRGLLTNSRWGQRESYYLCVNTSGREIRALIPPLAEYVRCWFGG